MLTSGEKRKPAKPDLGAGTRARRRDEPGQMPGMMNNAQMQQLSSASGPAFDRMFLQMMIAHHQGAVSMAQTELARGTNPATRQLAQQIITSQQAEIGEMQQLLQQS
jgi:uncharacterized protein (DUF305 family)